MALFHEFVTKMAICKGKKFSMEIILILLENRKDLKDCFTTYSGRNRNKIIDSLEKSKVLPDFKIYI